MRLDIGVRVLSMGGLISNVFAIPTSKLDTRQAHDIEPLLNNISQAPRALLAKNTFILDNANFGSLNAYVAIGVNLPATTNDFNMKYDKDKFYSSMKDVIIQHGDFYAVGDEFFPSYK
ncbi:hypothetical protein ABW20_dc0100479 [Dactylellina cionopaga]|nr:hypothetical protein ABW20_dc0100479 [Dactylellina cionopaga]